MSDETYKRVCVLERGHDGAHLPYGDAPDKDEFGNKAVAFPRCVHVSPVQHAERERYRIIFEMIDPRMPAAGWHEVVNEHDTLDEAISQANGIRELAALGDAVRNPRVERAVVAWEPA